MYFKINKNNMNKNIIKIFTLVVITIFTLTWNICFWIDSKDLDKNLTFNDTIKIYFNDVKSWKWILEKIDDIEEFNKKKSFNYETHTSLIWDWLTPEQKNKVTLDFIKTYKNNVDKLEVKDLIWYLSNYTPTIRTWYWVKDYVDLTKEINQITNDFYDLPRFWLKNLDFMKRTDNYTSSVQILKMTQDKKWFNSLSQKEQELIYRWIQSRIHFSESQVEFDKKMTTKTQTIELKISNILKETISWDTWTKGAIYKFSNEKLDLLQKKVYNLRIRSNVEWKYYVERLNYPSSRWEFPFYNWSWIANYKTSSWYWNDLWLIVKNYKNFLELQHIWEMYANLERSLKFHKTNREENVWDMFSF